MFGNDGSYVVLNDQIGFAGYDANNNKIYWVDKDEFHMKKSVVEEEITFLNRMRFIPLKIEEKHDELGNIISRAHDGVAIVSVPDTSIES
jgi:hypothetical protein